MGWSTLPREEERAGFVVPSARTGCTAPATRHARAHPGTAPPIRRENHTEAAKSLAVISPARNARASRPDSAQKCAAPSSALTAPIPTLERPATAAASGGGRRGGCLAAEQKCRTSVSGRPGAGGLPAYLCRCRAQSLRGLGPDCSAPRPAIRSPRGAGAACRDPFVLRLPARIVSVSDAMRCALIVNSALTGQAVSRHD